MLLLEYNLLYNVMLASAVQWISSIPLLSDFPLTTPPHPTSQVITEHQVELPVWANNCKWSNIQRINLQNMQIYHAAQNKKKEKEKT